MITLHRRVAVLGPVRVAIETNHHALLEYLADFYALEDFNEAATPVDWTIEANLGVPEAAMMMTAWQVGYRSDKNARQAVINSMNPRNLAITVRKAVREALLDYCESHRYTMVHASALADDQQVIIVVGDKGSGKTTLAINGVLESGFRYLSNDHLILYRSDAGLMLTSLPTPIPVKIGTYFDYADQLGQPWENEGVDIEAHRLMSRSQRYSHDHRLLYTYRSLGQPHPLHTTLQGRHVIVVLAGYAGLGQPVGIPVPVADPTAALWPHVRFDWVFDPTLNSHFLPRTERDRDTYSTDSRERLAELIAGSQVVEWTHHGGIVPLLDGLSSGLSGQR